MTWIDPLSSHQPLVVLFLLVLLTNCVDGAPEEDAGQFVLADQMDPVNCQGCHPNHYREWSGSMHAYASQDPVFRAMNARGQRETEGALGDFCVQCHAPMAVKMGLTNDGLNLDQVPEAFQGVTCYFCHSVTGHTTEANNGLLLASDGAMRGGIRDPIENSFHKSVYSPLHDRHQQASSQLCGPCHDIELANGLELERTYKEWQSSLYQKPASEGGLSCSACHMDGRNDTAADVEGAPVRRVHSHMMPGIDVALDAFPDKTAQREAVQFMLDSTLLSQICVESLPGGFTELSLILENITAGHSWPSGSTQDRRAWVEVRGFLGEAEVFQSGVIPDDEPLFAQNDPYLWTLGHRAYGDDGEEVHMFWETESLEGETLMAPTARFPTDPNYIQTHVTHKILLPGTIVDRVEMLVHIRPIGLDVIDSLVDSGDLDAAVRDAIPTFDLAGSAVEWREDVGARCQPTATF
jgi:hypothetical protein